MNNYHGMHLSDMDFGDNLKTIVCHQCGRSISVEADENGALMWKTLKIVNQGDYYAQHQFFTSEDHTNFSMSVEISPEQ